MKIIRFMRLKFFRLRILAILTLCVLLCVALALYSSHAKSQFEHAFGQYEIAAAAQQNAAFTPGANSNSTRDSLNQTLGLILAKETKTQDRLQLADKALSLIEEMNDQIDQIGKTATAASESIAALEKQASAPGNLLRRNALLEIISLAKKQLQISEDIRGLSYRSDFQIKQICEHIKNEKGVLTDAYVTELNNELPDVEAQFTLRQNAYNDLETNVTTIEKKYKTWYQAQW